MRRALQLLVALVALSLLQFYFFPGHSYLQSGTQVDVAAIEHLASPGLLSRDIAATHSFLAYTAYDETALFLTKVARLTTRCALQSQQLFFRFVELLAFFLIARSAALTRRWALATAFFVACGAAVYGPEVSLAIREPTPLAFAICLVFFSVAAFGRGKPLLAGLSGGLALIFQPIIAAPLWLLVIGAALFDRNLRPLLRPSLPILAVFVLLLANLAQLQPAVPESHSILETLSVSSEAVQRFRTPDLFVSLWTLKTFCFYAALLVVGSLAMLRIWHALNRVLKLFFLGLPCFGLAAVALSCFGLECLHLRIVPELQPARLLLFTLAISSLACAMAGFQELQQKRPSAMAFLAITVLLPFTALPVPRQAHTDVASLADWAKQNTWGGSMFLFPDAGRENYPGVFRAQSLRAVWVDWQSGIQVDYFDSFASEWMERWNATMQQPFSRDRVRQFLPLPLDYCVLKRPHTIAGAQPVFSTPDFVVYDVQQLRDRLPR